MNPIRDLADAARRLLGADGPCPACGAAAGPGAAFCSACGAALSSAGRPTERLTGSPDSADPGGEELLYPAWRQAGPYTVRLRQAIEATVTNPYDKSRAPQRVRLFEVEYRNEQREVLSYRLNQWRLYDTRGFAYAAETAEYYFDGRQRWRLAEGALDVGRNVRGWVAIPVPDDAAPSYLQFMSGYLASKTTSFELR